MLLSARDHIPERISMTNPTGTAIIHMRTRTSQPAALPAPFFILSFLFLISSEDLFIFCTSRINHLFFYIFYIFYTVYFSENRI